MRQVNDLMFEQVTRLRFEQCARLSELTLHWN